MKTKEISTIDGTSNNFVSVEPDSQFYGDLHQILTSLQYNMDRQYMIIGIQNTIKRGYKLTLSKTKKKKK
jgi:hypothetical protein